jgi:hypothetical protein
MDSRPGRSSTHPATSHLHELGTHAGCPTSTSGPDHPHGRGGAHHGQPHLPSCPAVPQHGRPRRPRPPDYEAVTRAAEALAARASTEQLVAGPLWEADGASLLAAAYAFHAGLPRQAATAPTSRRWPRPAQRRPMVASKPLKATPSPARQAILQVGPPRPLRRRARALPQWTQASAWPSPSPPGPS